MEHNRLRLAGYDELFCILFLINVQPARVQTVAYPEIGSSIIGSDHTAAKRENGYEDCKAAHAQPPLPVLLQVAELRFSSRHLLSAPG